MLALPYKNTLKSLKKILWEPTHRSLSSVKHYPHNLLLFTSSKFAMNNY